MSTSNLNSSQLQEMYRVTNAASVRCMFAKMVSLLMSNDLKDAKQFILSSLDDVMLVEYPQPFTSVEAFKEYLASEVYNVRFNKYDICRPETKLIRLVAGIPFPYVNLSKYVDYPWTAYDDFNHSKVDSKTLFQNFIKTDDLGFSTVPMGCKAKPIVQAKPVISQDILQPKSNIIYWIAVVYADERGRVLTGTRGKKPSTPAWNEYAIGPQGLYVWTLPMGKVTCSDQHPERAKARAASVLFKETGFMINPRNFTHLRDSVFWGFSSEMDPEAGEYARCIYNDEDGNENHVMIMTTLFNTMSIVSHRAIDLINSGVDTSWLEEVQNLSERVNLSSDAEVVIRPSMIKDALHFTSPEFSNVSNADVSNRLDFMSFMTLSDIRECDYPSEMINHLLHSTEPWAEELRRVSDEDSASSLFVRTSRRGNSIECEHGYHSDGEEDN